jgi:phospholipid N-methyltransferase
MNKKIFIVIILFPLYAISINDTNNLNQDTEPHGILKDLKTYWSDNIELLKASWANHKEVSALTVSSPWLVRELISPFVNAQQNRSEGFRILEVGFGPGTVTRELIQNLDNNHLDAIELIESMYNAAKENLPQKKTVHLFQSDFSQWLPTGINDIQEITHEQQYDFIITTLPFTQLPQEILTPILERISAFLKPGGTFTYISLLGAETVTSLLKWGKSNEEYHDRINLFSTWKNQNFYSLNEESTPSRHEIVYLNIPPGRVTHLVKK